MLIGRVVGLENDAYGSTLPASVLHDASPPFQAKPKEGSRASSAGEKAQTIYANPQLAAVNYCTPVAAFQRALSNGLSEHQ